MDISQLLSPEPIQMAIAPVVLASLLSMAPGLLSKLFGGDPQPKLRKQIAQLMSAQNVGKATEGFYQQAIGSPAYGQAQGTIAAGANQAGGQLASALGARGIGTSGSAAVLQSLIPSLVGSQQAGLRTTAYQSAQDRAMQQIQAQIAALTGSQGPSQSSQLFAGGLGALGPILQQYLASRGGGGGGWNMYGGPTSQFS